jgi:hypothetical protein
MKSIKRIILPVLVIFATGCIKFDPEVDPENPTTKTVTQSVVAEGNYGYVIKIKVDSSEYLIARGTECIAIIKHK